MRGVYYDWREDHHREDNYDSVSRELSTLSALLHPDP